jgi:hypothetical protein
MGFALQGEEEMTKRILAAVFITVLGLAAPLLSATADCCGSEAACCRAGACCQK